MNDTRRLLRRWSFITLPLCVRPSTLAWAVKQAPPAEASLLLSCCPTDRDDSLEVGSCRVPPLFASVPAYRS
jgi:hypothetical protein